jgi:hypothetical protein
MKDKAQKYFDPSVTDRERAVFEGGIALGALVHQLVGTPITRDRDVIKAVEKAAEKAFLLQPYRAAVKVRLDPKLLKKRRRGDPYSYTALQGRHLKVEVKTHYGKAEATLKMEYLPQLDFSLMYIEKIREK